MPDVRVPDAIPELREIVLTLCSLCLRGQGGECHTPGCALWMNRAPDLPVAAFREHVGEGP